MASAEATIVFPSLDSSLGAMLLGAFLSTMYVPPSQHPLRVAKCPGKPIWDKRPSNVSVFEDALKRYVLHQDYGAFQLLCAIT